MARRLALLAILLAAAAVGRANRTHIHSSGEDPDSSIDVFRFWDYDDAIKNVAPKFKNSVKVIKKIKIPKFNVTMLRPKSADKKKIVKTTNINIAHRLKYVLTMKPPTMEKPVGWAGDGRPVVKVHGQYVLLDVPVPVPRPDLEPSTRKPPRLPASTHSTRKPTRSTKPPKKTTTKTTPRPKPRTTTRRKPQTTKKRTTTVRPKPPQRRTAKPTKATTSKTTCKPNKTHGLSSFFQSNTTKPPKQRWITALRTSHITKLEPRPTRMPKKCPAIKTPCPKPQPQKTCSKQRPVTPCSKRRRTQVPVKHRRTKVPIKHRRTQRRLAAPTQIAISELTYQPNPSSEYLDNDGLKNDKKPWLTGLFTSFYKWFSTSLWSGDSYSNSTPETTPTIEVQRSTTTTTTTTKAPSLASNWFQVFLASEEIDDSYVATPKKSTKKSKKTYKGYQLLRAYPDAQWKIHELLELQEDGEGSGITWWTAPTLNGSTDVLVPPDLLPDVKDHLRSAKVDFDVVIWDLQKAIMYENPPLSKKQRLELEEIRGHPMTWKRFHRYADILRYLEYVQHSYADLVELIPFGRSSEGLPLVAVKISRPSNETDTKETTNKVRKKYKLRSKMKPAVWIDAGMHAREWIAPAVATWFIQAIVEGDGGLEPESEVLNQADIYILPVMNPDGYEHSHTHDRLWKKTRSRIEQPQDFFSGWFPWNWGQADCIGVDMDRNWDYHWSEKDSSKDPCSENYGGPHPFSEPENRAVSEFLMENREQIKVYISLHAYSQSWLLPSTHAHVGFPDEGVLLEMGKLATAALADMYGTKYKVGTAAEIRQPASGMSHDWAKARAGIKFSYHVDLRDKYGPSAFLLPGSQIVPTARETWQAIRAVIDNLAPG